MEKNYSLRIFKKNMKKVEKVIQRVRKIIFFGFFSGSMKNDEKGSYIAEKGQN